MTPDPMRALAEKLLARFKYRIVNTSDDVKLLDDVAAALRTNPASAPVAWRVKDFADGWILVHSEREAKRQSEACGNLVQPLYAHPASNSSEAMREALEAAKRDIDSCLNDYLCDMKEGYDDSIVGFNEAWDIVRKRFKKRIEALSASPGPSASESGMEFGSDKNRHDASTDPE